MQNGNAPHWKCGSLTGTVRSSRTLSDGWVLLNGKGPASKAGVPKRHMQVQILLHPNFMEECDNGSQAVLKTVGVMSAWGFESLFFRISTLRLMVAANRFEGDYFSIIL